MYNNVDTKTYCTKSLINIARQKHVSNRYTLM